MIEVVKFSPEHVLQVKLQPMQAEALPEMSLEYGQELEKRGPAVTGIRDGRVLFCGGRARLAERRWYAWALLSEEARSCMARVTRIARRMIQLQAGYGDLYALIRCDFPQAHRWAVMLGFNKVRSVEIDGLPCDLYLRSC